MTAPQKTHYASPEVIKLMLALEREVNSLRERCSTLELSAKQSAEKAEDLKAALRYYADSENYKPRVLEGVDMVIIPVCDDRGEIARRAL